MGYLEAGLEKM